MIAVFYLLSAFMMCKLQRSARPPDNACIGTKAIAPPPEDTRGSVEQCNPIGKKTHTKKGKHVPVFVESLCKLVKNYRNRIWKEVRREPKRIEGRFPLVGAWFNSHLNALEAMDSLPCHLSCIK